MNVSMSIYLLSSLVLSFRRLRVVHLPRHPHPLLLHSKRYSLPLLRPGSLLVIFVDALAQP